MDIIVKELGFMFAGGLVTLGLIFFYKSIRCHFYNITPRREARV